MCHLAPYLHQTALLSVILSWVSGMSRVFMLYTPYLRSHHFTPLDPFLLRISKTPPSPCVVTYIGRPRPPQGSSLGFHLRSTRGRLACFNQPYSVITSFGFFPHSHTQSATPYGYVAFLRFPHALAQGCFSLLFTT